MMNEKLSARIVEFSEGAEALDFLEMAEETFFADFIEETGAQTFDDVENLIGEYGWIHVFPCLIEFFLSNDYEISSPKGDKVIWNAVDCFLAGDGKNVTPAERAYLEGLRDSHMSLYRVIETGPQETLRLHDMIEDSEVVTEGRSGLASKMQSGQTFGIRLVKAGNLKTVAGGIIPFTPETAKDIASDLRALLTRALKAVSMPSSAQAGEEPLTERDKEHLTRVMLAPEIVTAFMQDMMEREMLVKSISSIKEKSKKTEKRKSKKGT